MAWRLFLRMYVLHVTQLQASNLSFFVSGLARDNILWFCGGETDHRQVCATYSPAAEGSRGLVFRYVVTLCKTDGMERSGTTGIWLESIGLSRSCDVSCVNVTL